MCNKSVVSNSTNESKLYKEVLSRHDMVQRDKETRKARRNTKSRAKTRCASYGSVWDD